MMYKSFETTKGYRPLLPHKETKWKLWIGIPLFIGIVVCCLVIFNPTFFESRPYIPEKATTFKDQTTLLTIENNNLKVQLTNYQSALFELTNKFNYVYALYSQTHTNYLISLSNQIALVNDALNMKELLIVGEIEKAAIYQQLEKLTNK